MGVLELAKLVELLNVGDLHRCGCAGAGIREFFTETQVLRRVKTTPGRFSSFERSHSRPQEERPQSLEEQGSSSEEGVQDATSDAEEDIVFTGLTNEADDISVSSGSRPLLSSQTWLGPEKILTEQASPHDVDSSHDRSSMQPISWDLPPLAAPSLLDSQMGASLWCGSPLGKPAAAAIPVASHFPFSALLCQVLSDMALQAQSEHGVNDSEMATLGHRQLLFASAPPVAEVPATELARKTPCRGSKCSRKHSAAELWLGVEPHD